MDREIHFSFVSYFSMALKGTVPKAAQPHLAESGFKPRWSGIRLFILTYNKPSFYWWAMYTVCIKAQGFISLSIFVCLQIKKLRDSLMFTELLIIQNFFEDVTLIFFLICSNYVVFLLSLDYYTPQLISLNLFVNKLFH